MRPAWKRGVLRIVAESHETSLDNLIATSGVRAASRVEGIHIERVSTG